MKKYITFTAFSLLILSSFAQNQVIVTSDSTKKYKLNIKFNYGKKLFFTKAAYDYNGEYYNNDLEVWEWRQNSIEDFDRSTSSKYNFIAIETSLGLYKDLKFGLAYHGHFIKSNRSDTTFVINDSIEIKRRSDYAAFAINGLISYDFQIKPIPFLYVIPSFYIGTYQTFEGPYTGKGLELYTAYRLSLTYKIHNRIGFEVFSEYSDLNYSYQDESRIFEGKDQSTKSKMQFFKLGFGLSYDFDLIPD